MINFRGIYVKNGNVYETKSAGERERGYLLATTTSGLIMATLPVFSKPFMKQMVKEHANNENYKNYFFDALDISGLKKFGVKIINMDPSKYRYLANSENDIEAGLNACYVPKAKVVKINAEKASIAGFHELGHAMNHLQSKFWRTMQKLRYPGYTVAGLMGTIAIFGRMKGKDEKANAVTNIFDFIQNNCGKIAFLAMLPTVLEEGMASYKGIKLAERTGLSKKLIKNLKIFNGKALLTYVGYALATAISVFAAGKITEHYTKPQLIGRVDEYNQY